MYYNIGIAIVMIAVVIVCSAQAVWLKYDRRAYQKATKELNSLMSEVNALGKDARKHLASVEALHISEGERLAGKECKKLYDEWSEGILNGTREK